MATVEEVLATMSEGDSTGTIAEVLVIDPATRQINVPESELVFGVESDATAERKYFQCSRYVGDGIDLAACFIRVNFRNANGVMDSYLVDDVSVVGDDVVFSWVLSQKVTAYRGQTRFVVCAVGPSLTVEWHTAQATGIVLEGLEPDSAVAEAGTADVVAQLIALVERQTMEVEAEGGKQIEAVQTAAETAEAASAARIEAKGASTLATIPGDYTTVQSAVRGAANAIRGKVSGEVIRVDDVSPMEHYPEIKVCGKNLWNMAVITSADGKFVNNGDGTITVNGGEYYCRAAQTLAEICPQLRVGDVVKFTISTTAYAGIFLNTANTLVQNGYALTITEAMLASYVALYGVLDTDESFNDPHTINSIQLERGTVATEYTPYIDPTTVTVTRCGENLISPPYAHSSGYTSNGVTFTIEEDYSVVINGTPTGTTEFLFERALKLPVGIYTYRLFGVENAPDMCSGVVNQYSGEIWRKGLGSDRGSGVTFEITDADAEYVVRTNVYILASNKTFTNFRVCPVLCAGTNVGGYEPYSGETQIPAADGTVNGLSANSPTMTLFADKPGVNIECEYSRDTNKVIAEILEKITALGG